MKISTSISAMVIGIIGIAGTVSAADLPSGAAIAHLKPTTGNTASGTVKFTSVPGGVEVDANVSGLPAGSHGFHIHEVGDCSAADGSSAGGHFNPESKAHGAPDAKEHHAGDLGNITIGADGKGKLSMKDSLLQLSGQESIVGRAIILHANQDDMKTQPTGNAGARIACGVIEPETKHETR